MGTKCNAFLETINRYRNMVYVMPIHKLLRIYLKETGYLYYFAGLAGGKQRVANVKMLLGNHEYMLLRALGCPYDENTDDGGALAHWYRNGGKVTHDYLKRIRKTLRQEIFAYLLALPLSLDVRVEGRDYKLVHAAPAEAYDRDPKYKTAAHFAVWKRLEAEDPLPGGYTLIFGHTATRHFQPQLPMEIFFGEDRIGIDCGSGYPASAGGGRLACLRLEDGAVFYSEES